MRKGKFCYLAFFILVFSLVCTPVMAQQTSGNQPADSAASGSQGNAFFNNLLNTVGQVLNEKLKDEFDRWLGKYEGKIEQVRLLEQTPDSIVLEVTYSGIKQQDGVSAKGEVLRGGMVLPGFTSTLGQVQGRQGIARLTISREASSGWDTSAPSTETSDQIRLYLVRNDYPDRHFGELIYDFPKTWGEDAYGVDAEADNGEAVELGEDSGNQAGSAPVYKPIIKPGVILVPVNRPKQNTPAPTGKIEGGTLHTVPGKVLSIPIDHYDFYTNAHQATWRSSRGVLHFPGSNNDPKGFAMQLSSGKISSRGVAAANLLETHPAWSSNGWIEGRYPAMTLKPGVHFYSTAALLTGANGSNGVIFKLYVKQNSTGKITRVYSRHVHYSDIIDIDVNLSSWANKNISLILRVEAAGNSARDWAVWVAPHLGK